MENKLRKFKLIDKEGFIAADEVNKGLLNKHLEEGGFISGYCNEDGNICSCGNVYTIICRDELLYFKEVTPYNVPCKKEEILLEQTLWREDTPLEKSLIVGKKGQGDKPFQIEHVGEELVLLKEVDSGKESCSTKDNLKSLLPDEDEILFQKVLSNWQSTSLDNAYDYRGSVVSL
jgi:hypothetical protein